MSVISVIAAFIAVILFYCAISFTGRKESYRSGVKYLIIGLIFMITSIVCKTEDVKAWLLGIYASASFFPFIFAFFAFSKEKGNRSFGLMGLSVFVSLVIALSFSGMKWSSKTPNYNHDYDNDDNYYDDYDYDNDGNINQNEWEDALGDYMDNIMG